MFDTDPVYWTLLIVVVVVGGIGYAVLWFFRPTAFEAKSLSLELAEALDDNSVEEDRLISITEELIIHEINQLRVESGLPKLGMLEALAHVDEWTKSEVSSSVLGQDISDKLSMMLSVHRQFMERRVSGETWVKTRTRQYQELVELRNELARQSDDAQQKNKA